MGVEGQISSNYWSAFGVIIKKEGFQRTHKDSKDSINQALNYGYAILYNRIQASLLKEGLNIYYAFLHSNNYQNPSLVYDFIEPFRTPVVDREIIALFVRHHNIKIKSNNLLDEKSKKLITEHIQKRLASTTKTKYGKTTFNNLIDFETNELKRNIEKGTIHKFYLAKY
jgi:CRISPR-associated protein Cas1